MLKAAGAASTKGRIAEHRMNLPIRLLLIALAVYLAGFAALVLFQRRLMYFPAGPVGPASAWGFPQAKTLKLATEDGETVVVWYQPAAGDKPLYVYFHGNGGTLAARAAFLHDLGADGSGFVALDYRGYGGSTGRPSEPGLIADGRAALAFALQQEAASRIVVIGESLGTAVAVAVTGDQHVRALILDSPFSSTADIAAARFPIFPVRLAMLDTFDSDARIARVTVPKLFISGSGDRITPMRFARKLFEHAAEPKTFLAVDDRGHMQLRHKSVLEQAKAWLAALPAPPPPAAQDP